MDSAVVVALISSSASVLIATGTTLWARSESRRLTESQNASAKALETLRHRFDEETREEGRRAKETATLARYREPLLEAASDLQHRLHNIREDSFLVNLHGARHDATIQTTLYRLARYFGWLEILYAELNYLRFDTPEESRAVASLLKDIGSTFASDKYDRTGGTSRFMIWREEQRAIGEVATCRGRDGSRELVGYSEFVERVTSDASKWFDRFIQDLESSDAPNSERLAKVEIQLAALTDRLREAQRLVI